MRQNFLVVRYSFETLFAEQASAQFIDDLRSHPFLDSPSQNYRYAIGNFNIEEHGSKKYLRATYGQSALNVQTNSYDPDKKEWHRAETQSVTSQLIELLIDPQKHLILVERKSSIKPETVAKKIEQIYNSTNKSYGQLKVHFITKEIEVFKELKRFKRVQKVTIKDLRPTNPDTLPDFAELEKHLIDTRSMDSKLEFKAVALPEGDSVTTEANLGLNTDSKLITQALSLSAHGYGEATVTGYTEDKTRVTITTRSYRLEVALDFDDPDVLEKATKFINDLQAGQKKAGT